MGHNRTAINSSSAASEGEGLERARSLSSEGCDGLTTNDVLAGLLWLVSCQVRGRPLPGQGLAVGGSKPKPPPTGASSNSPPGEGCRDGGGSFGLAADMRRNLSGGSLPPSFMGNASCLLHIRHVLYCDGCDVSSR